MPIMRNPAAPHATLAIEANHLFDGERLVGPRRVEIADGRNVAVLGTGSALETDAIVRLPESLILAPGFIDVQVNGGGGLAALDDRISIHRASIAGRNQAP